MARVLLLEPDRLLAKTYHTALVAAGHEVNICSSAQTAVFCADEFRPDLVLIELQLISHSGIEFLYEFRSYTDWQDIPAVLLTNVPAGEFADSWELLRGELNVSGYLYKPITSLKSIVQTVSQKTAVLST
jgi:DNA-binding response OmpR family regulator